MKLRVSFLLVLLSLAVTLCALAAETVPPPPMTPADLAGSWLLAPAESGGGSSGPGAITLVLTCDQGTLAGVAVVSLQYEEKRWPLVHPTFDGKTFAFKVDNGENLLAGEMKLVDGKFEGHWTGGGEAGRLTMTRKSN